MNIANLLTDEAILKEIGARIAQCRLERQLTQAQLAEQAGVAKRTVACAVARASYPCGGGG